MSTIGISRARTSSAAVFKCSNSLCWICLIWVSWIHIWGCSSYLILWIVVNQSYLNSWLHLMKRLRIKIGFQEFASLSWSKQNYICGLIAGCVISLRFEDKERFMHILEEIEEYDIRRLVSDGRSITLADNHVPSRTLVFEYRVRCVQCLVDCGRRLFV